MNELTEPTEAQRRANLLELLHALKHYYSILNGKA